MSASSREPRPIRGGSEGDDLLLLGGGAPLAATLTVTLAPIQLQAFIGRVRTQYATKFCRVHRLLYIEDDRFPAPCARWGGHEAGG